MAINPEKQLKKVLSIIQKADSLAEQAHMLMAEAYRYTSIARLDRASDSLSDAREVLGDAFHDIEQFLKDN